jgi:hypothetical protein
MSRLVVFATALSRLHADLLIVRLRQAGISRTSISALYAPSSRPNSGLCWLSGTARLALSSGEPVEVSGRLRVALGHGPAGAGHSSLLKRLADFGLTAKQSAELEESLLESHLVLAIEVHKEPALNSVFNVLQGLEAEKIMPVSTHAPIAQSHSPRFLRRLRRRASVAAGLPAFAAFA